MAGSESEAADARPALAALVLAEPSGLFSCVCGFPCKVWTLWVGEVWGGRSLLWP